MFTTAWPVWAALPAALRDEVGERIEGFIRRHRWEAAHGFVLPDGAVELIAAQGALLTHALADGCLAASGPFIVHPGPITLADDARVGTTGTLTARPPTLDGRAEYRGPVLLSWSAVKVDARHPRRGRNVVAHELAHQLDMADGVLNGTPVGLAAQLTARWARVCEAELRRLRAGHPGTMRTDAAEDPGEFFAVATETFLTLPEQFEADHPALYELLSRYYSLDPARWDWPDRPQ